MLARSGLGVQDADEVQLQRWLAQEEGERDASRIAFQRLHGAVDVYRQRLAALRPQPDGDPRPSIARARELLQSMEAEVASLRSVQVPHPPSRVSTYEVLSQSLKETQRQCEALNQEMVQQADGNEKLLESMGSVKAANKGLLEQIRSQQSDLAQLTQQCVGCEERLEQLRKRQDMEREQSRIDGLHQVALLREAWAERRSEVQQLLTQQLRSVQLKAVSLQSSIKELSGELKARRQESQALAAEVAAWFSLWQQDVPAQLLEPFRRRKQQKVEVEKCIGGLRSQLSQEREERHQESLQWGRKYGELQTDKEDLQARLVRECSQLEARLQALEKRQLEERHSWVEERTRMEEQCREQLAQLETCEADFETLTRASSLTETALSSKLAETQSLTKVVHELQRQAREAKDALAAAVSSNDHLKEQLHEQQARLEEKSGQDLQECQEPFEERLVEVKRQAEAEVALTNKQIEAMDGEVQECDQELVRLLTEQEALMDEVKHLAGDASFWRSSWDAENANREALENEMNAAKHHFNGELLTLETDCERIAVNNEDLEQEIRDLSGEAQQKRRLMVSREGESSARQAAAEAHLKESQELLGFCHQRLRDAAEQRARATADA